MGVIFPLLFKMLRSLSNEARKRSKEMGKEEVKLYTFTEDMTLYLKALKPPPENCLV